MHNRTWTCLVFKTYLDIAKTDMDTNTVLIYFIAISDEMRKEHLHRMVRFVQKKDGHYAVVNFYAANMQTNV